MFQYAFGTALAQRYKTSLLLDTSTYPDSSGRTYDLQHFMIKASTISHAIPITKTEDAFTFNPSFLEAGDNNCFDGYWQSEKYFAAIEPVIRRHLAFRYQIRPPDLAKEISNSESVAVSIRRGDYLRSDVMKIHGLMPLSWYRAACSLIQQKVQNPKFYIFTDEPGWNGLSQFDGVVVPGDKYVHLRLMTLCRHAIITNSSYSWWGSWLSQYTGLRIAPDKWFAIKDIDAKDIIPDRWYKLAVPDEKILVAVPACDKNRESQKAQQETWLGNLPNVDVRFFFGAGDQPTTKPNEVYLDVPGDYDHLCHKVYALIDWAYKQGYTYLFKCDTDTYAVPDRLLYSDYVCYDYVGRELNAEHRSGDVPFASGGAGYWLSRAAMKAILSHSLEEFTIFEGGLQPEDTAVSRLLAQHKIFLHWDTRYQSSISDAYPTKDNDIISTHYVTPEKMHEFYTSI
jgi:hypothetical protein